MYIVLVFANAHTVNVLCIYYVYARYSLFPDDFDARHSEELRWDTDLISVIF